MAVWPFNRRNRSQRSDVATPPKLSVARPRTDLPRPDSQHGGNTSNPYLEDYNGYAGSEALARSPRLLPASAQNTAIFDDETAMESRELLSERPVRHAMLQGRGSPSKRLAASSPLPRRRSTKKRKNDRAREDEIRAMGPFSITSNENLRSGFGGQTSSRALRRSHNATDEHLGMSETSLGFNGSSRTWTAPTLETKKKYRISMLDMFVPRPSLRNSIPPDWTQSLSDCRLPSKGTRRETRAIMREDLLIEDEPIDLLADDLGAAEIREILERDKRRRARRREKEADKLRRKLERRAERDRQREQEEEQQQQRPDLQDPFVEEAESRKNGLGIESGDADPVNASQEHATVAVGGATRRVRPYSNIAPHENGPTHIDSPEVVVLTTNRDTTDQDRCDTADSFMEHEDVDASNHDSSAIAPSMDETMPSPSLQEKQPVSQPMSAATAKRRSQAEAPTDQIEEDTVEEKPGFLASLFRRDLSRRKTRRRSTRETPPPEPSFRNVSRESMGHSSPIPRVRESASFVRSRSGTPVRTQSRFREDLPELPPSPPDSRVQSPEADHGSGRSPIRGFGQRYPLEEEEDVEMNNGGVIAIPRPSSLGPSEHPASIIATSLASVDSEGSWFAGRPLGRLSPPPQNIDDITTLGSRASTVRERSASHGTSVWNGEDALMGDVTYLDDSTSERTASISDLGPGIARYHDIAGGRRSIGGEHDVNGSGVRNAAMLVDIVRSPSTRPPVVTSGETTEQLGVLENRPPLATIESGDIMTGMQTNQSSLSNTQNPPGTEAMLREDDSSDEEDDEEALDAEHPHTQREQEEDLQLQRARSINVGRGHVRNVSAGSAKLLDIVKRTGSTSGASSPNLLHSAVAAPPPNPPSS